MEARTRIGSEESATDVIRFFAGEDKHFKTR
jgi:hypothetical protein